MNRKSVVIAIIAALILVVGIGAVAAATTPVRDGQNGGGQTAPHNIPMPVVAKTVVAKTVVAKMVVAKMVVAKMAACKPFASNVMLARSTTLIPS